MMTFDPEERIITVVFPSRKNIYKNLGEDSFQYILTDWNGNIQVSISFIYINHIEKLNFDWQPPVIDEFSDGKFVGAMIKKIDVFGEVIIQFSTPMQ
jgi:hypothetical protein